MNTRASVAYGWGILCLAGGGAYYFAKRSINSDRAERAMAEEKRRQQRERMRVTETASRDARLGSGASSATTSGKKKAPAPNAEKVQTSDPAPVEHAGGKEAGDPAAVEHDEGKFESKAPYRSRKGDRFS
ncbi:uncharacterized protein LTR77_009748 [Saxophila tyrrhenica]|uniref:Uncharacterized protein n=1 Tax=Saxophila tyrrhenica TaxID=1690608 RepID=A0AAV9P0J7_9PEZI|nr:hypothetical protein LTR77_009748 [Saxophila tyrrhenica]